MTKFFLSVALVSGCLALIAAPLDIALNMHGDLMPLFLWGCVGCFSSLCAGAVIGMWR